MLIKYGFTLFQVIILLLPAKFINADEDKYIYLNSSSLVTKRIDSFFTKNPDTLEFLWLPEIYGKSRYALSIYKEAYNISKKYSDASDLYYQTKKIDNGLSLHSNELKNISISFSEDNKKLIYKQYISSDYNVGFFFKEYKKTHLGLSAGKDFILSKNSLGNISIETSNDDNQLIQTKFVNLSSNENSELFINTSYQINSNNFDSKFGYTWFDLANQFDLAISLTQEDKKIKPEVYATFGDDAMKLQVGLFQGKKNSDTRIFFNLLFENVINMNDFRTSLSISSKSDINDSSSLSLKDFRKKSLDKIWRKHMLFE